MSPVSHNIEQQRRGCGPRKSRRDCVTRIAGSIRKGCGISECQVDAKHSEETPGQSISKHPIHSVGDNPSKEAAERPKQTSSDACYPQHFVARSMVILTHSSDQIAES